jgi:glycerophosphoryl diester phosphodiesterase
LMSFDMKLIEHFSNILPNINRGLIFEKFDHYRKTFSSSVERTVTEFQMQKNGISFVSQKYTDLTKDFYVFNNGKNRKVLTWTIKSELDAEKIRNFCDNITFEGFKPI